VHAFPAIVSIQLYYSRNWFDVISENEESYGESTYVIMTLKYQLNISLFDVYVIFRVNKNRLLEIIKLN